MKGIVGRIIFILSIPLALYLGTYLMFTKSAIRLLLGLGTLSIKDIAYNAVLIILSPLVIKTVISAGITIRKSLYKE